MSNDRNSKIQTMSRPERFWSLNIGICDLPARAPGRLALPVRHRLRLRRMPGGLGWRASSQWQAGLFVIWCLEFVILDTKLQGRAIISLTPAIRDRHGIED
jgi:hypothetical protein